MRTLITGAAGFLGSWVLRRFLEDQRHEVAVLLRPGSDLWRIHDLLRSTRVIEGDLAAIEAARPALAAFAPETVVHLAWSGVLSRYRNDAGQSLNVGRSAALLELSSELGVSHWIGLGSQAEYGPRPHRISEEDVPRPATVYGVSKLCVGLWARRFCAERGIRCAWLRLFSSYGARDDGSWLLPYLIRTLLRRQRPSLTAAEQCWDYLHADDAAEAIFRVAVASGVEGVFNLGSGVAVPLREVIEMVRDAIDPALPLGFGEVPYREDQVMHLEADIGRLKAAVQWSPRIPLSEGIRQTVEWYRQDQERR